MSYSGPETAKIVGISYRQLDYWCRTDLITPSIHEARGSGTRRSYSFRDLVDLAIVKAMLDAGIYLPATRKILRVLQAQVDLDLANTTLVIADDTVRLCGDDELAEIVRSHSRMIHVLPLYGVLDELDDRLHPVLDAAAV